MKISEMTNDQAAEAMIRMSEPLSNICDDDELVDMLDKFSKMQDMGLIRAIGKMLPKIIPYVFDKHKKDFFEIVGALDNKTLAQVQKMKFADTVKLIQDSYDEILKNFIRSSAPAAKKSAD